VCREACDHILGVEAGAFYDTIIPETVSALWGPVPLGKLTMQPVLRIRFRDPVPF
jgi:hypothetical protein